MCFIVRLTPGWVTFISLAAPAIVPATMTDRITSICRNVSVMRTLPLQRRALSDAQRSL
jgi:hypothetical protein